MAKRFLMWILLSVFISVFLLTFIPTSYHLIVLVVLSLALAVLSVLKYPLKATVIVCLIAAICSTGVFYFLNKSAESLINPLLNRAVTIQGKITDSASSSDRNYSQYKVRVDMIDGKNTPFHTPVYVYIYCDDFTFTPGDTLSGSVKFYDTPIQYGFGKEDRVFISGYQRGDLLQVKAPDGFDVHKTIYSFRESIKDKVSFGTDETNGLLKAVCLGDKKEIESNLYYSLKRIGLSHVMAVSGLHLAFAVAFFGFLFLLFGIDYRIRYIIGIFVAVFFTLAVGFPASCIRACIMLVVFSVGMAMNWFSDSLTSLSLAIFIIMLINPFSVRDVGFLLSASATAGIVTLQSPIENFLFPKKLGSDYRIIGVYRKFTGIISCSLAAIIATLPIAIVVFGWLSLIAPFANMLLILPFEIFFVLGVLMIVLSWIPFAGNIIGICCDLLYRLISRVSVFLGKFEFASVGFLDYRAIIFLVLLLLITAVSVYFFLKHQRRTFVALFSLFLCFIFLFSELYSVSHPKNDLEIAFIDVGQGDCTVLSKGNRAVIIDCGGSSDKRYNLISYLKENNIISIELLMFTHLHNDHTNGIFTLSKNSYVETLLYPPFDAENASLSVIFDEMDGQEISGDETITVLDDVQIEIYANTALDETSENENERCICYKVEYGSTSLLITGDLDGKGEMNLLQYDPECTILKVGHHGSKTSTFYPFLKAAAPEICIISSGENTYGLPDSTVLGRLETICSNILLTENEGTIRFITDGDVLERVYS